jgi:DNA-binding PadR family transcriptional regulator
MTNIKPTNQTPTNKYPIGLVPAYRVNVKCGKPFLEHKEFSETDIAILKELASKGKKQSSKIEHDLRISHASVYDSLKKLDKMGIIKVVKREKFRTGLEMKTFDITISGLYWVLQIQTWVEREQTFTSHKEKGWFFQEYFNMEEKGFINLARYFVRSVIDFYPPIRFMLEDMVVQLVQLIYPEQTINPPEINGLSPEQLSTIQKEAKSYAEKHPEIVSLMREAVNYWLEKYGNIGKSIEKDFPI